MNFQDLHELLRLELLRRIDRGELTGTRLAQQAGFQQAHISNFLNRKRALSLEGLDRVMAAQDLTIDRILPLTLTAAAIPQAIASNVPAEPVEAIPIVSASTAAEKSHIDPAVVIETLELSVTRLSAIRARTSPRQANWQRFVAIRCDAQQAAAVEPLLSAGSVAVIDRHYNSIAPYRSHEPSLFAVRLGHGLILRYVEFDETSLILRPSAMDCPVQLVAIGPGKTPSDFIVGRVCLIFAEL